MLGREIVVVPVWMQTERKAKDSRDKASASIQRARGTLGHVATDP